MNTSFKHSKCGGSLVVDFSNIFSVTSPSIVIDIEGIFPGVSEIKRNSSKKAQAKFRCLKCGEELEKTDVDKISCKCFACGGTKSSQRLKFLLDFRVIVCENCGTYLAGDKTVSLSEQAKKTLSYFSVRDVIKMVPLADIIKKPVSI